MSQTFLLQVSGNILEIFSSLILEAAESRKTAFEMALEKFICVVQYVVLTKNVI